jgi:DNA-binding IclR family transcriptional regulator
VPLRDHVGRTIAAAALSAPTTRLKDMDLREVVIQLRECARRIRADLAH